VVEGSVERDGLETTFVISDGTSEVVVSTDRPLPDSFRDDAATQVVALGSFDGRVFTATEVLAKCPSKFKAKA
jgi:cytochrome c-type biogenesis protein CcmE